MLKNKAALFCAAFGFVSFFGFAQQPVFQSAKAERWADSVLAVMPLEDKLGQLFMVAAYSNKGPEHEALLTNLVAKEKIGGLIFFQGGPHRQARITNRLQGASQVPLMIGMDAEWGLAMRLDSTFKFPWQMTLGAMQDTALTYAIGLEMGKQCKRLGVHVSFSPVVDINTNPKNPIINARSFGEDKKRVKAHSLAMMKGLQDAGVLACAKHFPGHGDTEADSHKTLPAVNHGIERLTNVELFPYQPMINKGLGSVMVAHLSVPALDSSGEAASLSPKIVTDLLRQQMGFEGLIFTDALNMKGVSARYQPGEVDLAALKAGNDILLFAEDVPKAKAAILAALGNNEISIERINQSVKRILMAKYFVGLNKKPIIKLQNLSADLSSPTAELLKERAMQQAQTLLINRNEMVPISQLADKKIACVQLGKNADQNFLNQLNLFAKVDGFAPGTDPNTVLNSLSKYDLVIAAYHTDDATPWKSYKPTDADKAFLSKLALQNKFILVVFANPYALSNFTEAEAANALILAYQNNNEGHKAAAQLIFGAEKAQGRLPVSASKLFDVGYGQQSTNLKRLGYALPEDVGINREKLKGIDALANKAIAAGATPGCQILVAKNGKVFYHKAFGNIDYKNGQKVTTNTIYDLASVTKVTATLPLIMRMVQEGALNLDVELGKVYPKAIGTNKEHIRLRDMLAHQAGLPAWIPFYVKTLENSRPSQALYRSKSEEGFTRQVTPNLYLKDTYVEEMFNTIMQAPLTETGYKYSDLGYYILKDIVEIYYRKPLDQLAAEWLYKPIGATTLGFEPLRRFKKDQIAPTEDDKTYRFETIQGTVHDQGAAMLGGVGGHAGLFSNANDLAKLMQLYLQYGYYGGQQIIDSATLAEFVRCQFCEKNNRRGAGFDKPTGTESGPTCNCVTMLSFGHTGFTGTIAWVDPEEEIVYVFLSNRTYPNAENRKLIEMDTRADIQEVIYNSLNSYKP
jgi:beta-glucosidase-like glycosyl hydrolase/CubicO group peptidase (beta-lactamase class C family)